MSMKATCNFKYLFLLPLLFCCQINAESVFSQLDKLEQAVTIANDRLESGIEQDTSQNADFAQIAGRQLEFALLSLDAGHLLVEDYYHFALYLIARQQANYVLAMELLEFEYKLAEFKALKNWLNKRILLMHSLQGPKAGIDSKFTIRDEFASFRKMLKKLGK